MTSKAYSRVWMLRRLKTLGTEKSDLLDVYIKQVRSILEFAVPVWHPSLTLADKANLECVQKTVLHVILGENYHDYKDALKETNLESLEERRTKLCEKFSFKAVKHKKHNNWFKENTKITKTRQVQPKLCPVISRTICFQKSPISYLTDLLKTKFNNQKKWHANQNTLTFLQVNYWSCGEGS